MSESEKKIISNKCCLRGEQFWNIEGPFTMAVNQLSSQFLVHILNDPDLIKMVGKGYWDLEIKLSPNLELEKENSGREEEEPQA